MGQSLKSVHFLLVTIYNCGIYTLHKINPEYHHNMEKLPGNKLDTSSQELYLTEYVFTKAKTITMIDITIHRAYNNRLMLINKFTTQRTSFTFTITTGNCGNCERETSS